MTEELTLPQLRFLTLESQGLTKPYPFGKGKDVVLKALENLGYLQIDTLSIVERAHHYKLWTRIPDYKTEYLDKLVEERKVFEYWFHATSYLPMNDSNFAKKQYLNIVRIRAIENDKNISKMFLSRNFMLFYQRVKLLNIRIKI